MIKVLRNKELNKWKEKKERNNNNLFELNRLENRKGAKNKRIGLNGFFRLAIERKQKNDNLYILRFFV